MLKNKSLFIQIWLVCLSLVVGVFVLFMLVIPLILKSFFTDDIYSRMEEIQRHFFEFPISESYLPEPIKRPPVEDNFDDNYMVRNIVLFKHDPQMQKPSPINYHLIEKEAINQTLSEKRYKETIGDRTLLYIIKKQNGIILFTYAWSNFRTQLIQHLMKRLIYLGIVVILVSFPLSILFARRLSNPLIQITEHVKELSERKWNRSLVLHRKDEVGKLALSVERLRKRLIKHDEKQQNFIQHVSHELKTPVMVIQSYLEAIEDGIYPKGNLKGSISVLKEETDRLNKKIKDLLYLTKLDYFSEEELTYSSVELMPFLTSVMEKFLYQRKDIKFELDIPTLFLLCNPEQIGIVFENIIQNQLRYAKTYFEVKAFEEKESIVIQLFNDGEKIDPEHIKKIFEPFYKGNKGQFGLGLAIVKTIIDKHRGKIEAINEENGVMFSLTFPKNDQ